MKSASKPMLGKSIAAMIPPASRQGSDRLLDGKGRRDQAAEVKGPSL
jgi:hypothetical protein